MSQFESDTAVESHTKLSRPSLYKVVLHNDNYTSRDFVVDLLRAVFHHPESEAERIMLEVHNKGMGIAGTYTLEIAEMKLRKSEIIVQKTEFPLRLSIEPVGN